MITYERIEVIECACVMHGLVGGDCRMLVDLGNGKYQSKKEEFPDDHGRNHRRRSRLETSATSRHRYTYEHQVNMTIDETLC